MQREISLKQKCVALEKLCRTMNAERETIGKEAENARRVENEHFSTSLAHLSEQFKNHSAQVSLVEEENKMYACCF